MSNPINYDPNTPTKKLSFADWQIQFIQNFTQLGEAFSKNHIPLDDPTVADRGNHTIVELVEQTTDGQTSANEFSIFVRDVESQTDQIFFTYPGNTPTVQFTNYQIYSVTPTEQQTTYFTFLPGKILIYFGTFTGFGSGFAQGFNNIIKLNPPVSKNIVSVNLCHIGTTPKYTPAAQPAFSLDAAWNATILPNEIYLIPVVPSSNNSVFYYVVANI